MVLASEQDPDLELISDLEEGPPVLTPVENTRAESISSDEEVNESVDSDNQQNKKVEGGYECKYCTFQTPDLNMFTFHVDSEHPNVVLNSSYVCVECNFLTKRYDALSEHNLKYHPGEENFKLTMVKRNNQTIFEQTINDLTFDGSFVKEENLEQAEPTEVSSSGISISKTPIMKMMKNKVENKRIAVHHNSVEDVPEEKENEIKPDREEIVENPSSSASESNTSTSIVNRIHPSTASTVVTPAAVLKENKCLLLAFFLLLLLVFLLEATIAILFFVYTDKIDRYAQQDLKKGLHLYGTQGNVGLTNAWSIIQTDFRCCGVSNYTDWFEVYNATRVPDSCCLEFSESCGLHAPGTWWKAPCYETVKVWLQENLLAVGIFGLCTALVQILGLTFAMTMYCQVVKADTYCA